MISPKVIEEILSRADIVEVISSYYPLQGTGKNFRTLCPFHLEKKPSFTVSPEKQIFHCFGCGVGGNVIHFIMLQEKVTFPEAVRILADKLGIKIEEEPLSAHIYEVMDRARVFYQKKLYSPQGKKAYEYLKKRGIKEQTIKKFSLGYAPPDTEIIQVLQKEGVSVDLLEKAGLILQRQLQPIPYFRQRIIFPIFNLGGKVVGFGGRVLEEGEPKYLNSPDSPVFEKGKVLYGMNLAKEEIRGKKKVMLVEGYMDVISLFQAGIEWACASLGTSLTHYQATLLKRYAEEVILVFDSDEAGKDAASRALEILLPEGIDCRVFLLPYPHDPDSFVQREGKERFLELMKESTEGMEFYIDHQKGKKDKKEEAYQEVLLLLSRLRDPLKKHEYMRKICQSFGLREQEVVDSLNYLKTKEKSTPPLSAHYFPPTPEEYLLSLILKFPHFLEVLQKELTLEMIEDEEIKKIFSLLFTWKEGKEVRIPLLLQELSEEERRRVSSLIMKDLPHPHPDRELEDCLKKIKERFLSRQKEKIRQSLREAEEKGDQTLVSQLLRQLVTLNKLGYNFKRVKENEEIRP